MLRQLAAGTIVGYQRYVSPYKGFRCAYRCQTGRYSCSEYARRVTLRLGVLALWTALPRQFLRCRLAYQAILSAADDNKSSDKHSSNKRRWWDHVDCNPCDVSGCDLPCDCSI